MTMKNIEIHPDSDERYRPGVFSLSAAGFCPRRQQYDFKGTKHTNLVSPRIRRIHQVGHAIEKIVVDNIEARGGVLTKGPDGEQIEVWGEDPPAVGHLDGIWDGIPFDVKSVPKGWVRKLKSSEYQRIGFEGWCHYLGVRMSSFDDLVFISPEDPTFSGVKELFPDYWTQGQMYMHHGRTSLPDLANWDLFWFIGFHKDTSKILIEEIKYDEAFCLEVLEKLRNLTGDLVDRPVGYEKDKFPCGWCPFRDLCWQSK